MAKSKAWSPPETMVILRSPFLLAKISVGFVELIHYTFGAVGLAQIARAMEEKK